MEKRVLIASAICILFLAAYANVMSRMYPATQGKPSTPAATTLSAPQPTSSSLQQLDEEDVTTLESTTLRVEIGERSAAIRSVTLKGFQGEGGQPLKIASSFPLLSVKSDEERGAWKLVGSGPDRADFVYSGAKQYHISYMLVSDKALINMTLGADSATDDSSIEVLSVWTKADQLDDRNNPIEASLLQQKAGDKVGYKKLHGAQKAEKNVPRGTLMVALTERYFCQILKPESGAMAISLLPSPTGTIATKSVITLAPGTEQNLTIYVGPRDFFHLRQVGMEKAFEIGILGQIGLILLNALSFIARITRNYGTAIILFSAGITLMMAPFTLLGMRSMKRMQALKPQIDKVMAQHKDDPTRANKEVFALYRENKISPMSGCLPMLLQMPIFIALFQAISHYIELRGASFLWIKDLSLSDRAAILPFSLPLLGNELNLLPIIMAGAMFLQTRLQAGAHSAGADQDPTTKILQGPMMAVIFGFMFYHFPAGLVLYWLTNNLVSIALYRLAK